MFVDMAKPFELCCSLPVCLPHGYEDAGSNWLDLGHKCIVLQKEVCVDNVVMLQSGCCGGGEPCHAMPCNPTSP
jgi:hypothetical protein